jgi:hypothetical protein
MRKLLLLSTLLVSCVIGRENPFFSTAENKNFPISNNQVIHKPPLTSMTYTVPDQSRILKEVNFTFQNLDGSFETRKLEIDQSINWRSPLVLSQGDAYKAPAETSIVSSQSKQNFIQIINSGNRINLITTEPMLHSFSLTKPESLIIDFKHAKDFEPFEKELNTPPYKKVHIAYHGTFARVTLTLDGHHVCNVAKSTQGAMAVCK